MESGGLSKGTVRRVESSGGWLLGGVLVGKSSTWWRTGELGADVSGELTRKSAISQMGADWVGELENPYLLYPHPFQERGGWPGSSLGGYPREKTVDCESKGNCRPSAIEL